MPFQYGAQLRAFQPQLQKLITLQNKAIKLNGGGYPPVWKVSTMHRRSPKHNILLAQQIFVQNQSRNGWRGAKKQNFR